VTPFLLGFLVTLFFRYTDTMFTELFDTVCAATSKNPVTGVVAIEPVGTFMRVFRRADGNTTFQDYPFRPFFLLTDPVAIKMAPVATECRSLGGNGSLRWLITVETWHDWCLLREYLQQTSTPDTWYGTFDSRQQFLIVSGITLFRKLPVEQIRMVCLSVTTPSNSVTLPPADTTASILSITLSDGTGYEEQFSTKQLSEPELLNQLTSRIRGIDPDIIAGYNLVRHDLPLLIKRAHTLGVRLCWGRNGSVIQLPDSRKKTAQFESFGRTILDISALVRQYDQQVQPVQSNDLYHAATWFDCVSQDDHRDTPYTEIRLATALFQRLIPLWLLKTQLYPITLQMAVTKSGGAAALAVLVREYLHREHALPGLCGHTMPLQSDTGSQFFLQGRTGPVHHCDLTSLKASIMLAYRIAPRSDELGLFLPIVSTILTLCRSLNAQEGTWHLKSAAILLPAWYQLLTQHHLFADPTAAHELERLTQVITKDLLGWLETKGARPVVVDRQGVYFVPPLIPLTQNDCDVEILRQTGPLIASYLHKDKVSYPAMFIYKLNNFALLEQNGGAVFRGNYFYSRTREAFLRDFLQRAVTLVLEGRTEKVRDLYAIFVKKLVAHDCPVDWVMRTEVLTDAPEHYQQAVLTGKRNRSAIHELALSVPGRWRVGDRISYYITGNSKYLAAYEYCKLADNFDPSHPDINTPWYTERLHLLFKRFEPFIPSEPLLFG
jgi:hypothetical protein